MSTRWLELAREALSRWPTPFYLSAWEPVAEALSELDTAIGIVPHEHWLSFKTHPLAPLVRRWRDTGRGVEVVSEYEFLAALKEGFQPEKILVNGVAKHNWLPRHKVKGIRVHFDSLYETQQLAVQAAEDEWRCGVRFHPSEEHDPDEPSFGGQFGMCDAELGVALSALEERGVQCESVHFHLRSNVLRAEAYERALAHLSETCAQVGLCPLYIDFGGGLPVPEASSAGGPGSVGPFNFEKLREVFHSVRTFLPSVREIWLENGRFLTGRSAALVVKVRDIKERTECRYLICDGGRTNNALASDWESHDILLLPERTGEPRYTTICGPTCMAFDRLARTMLPRSIEVGDCLLWMDAGAYHVPWETRFSHGLAKVIWSESPGQLILGREAETFPEWWGQWT